MKAFAAIIQPPASILILRKHRGCAIIMLPAFSKIQKETFGLGAIPVKQATGAEGFAVTMETYLLTFPKRKALEIWMSIQFLKIRILTFGLAPREACFVSILHRANL